MTVSSTLVALLEADSTAGLSKVPASSIATDGAELTNSSSKFDLNSSTGSSLYCASLIAVEMANKASLTSSAASSLDFSPSSGLPSASASELALASGKILEISIKSLTDKLPTSPTLDKKS